MEPQQAPDEFETARKSARRQQIAMNVLVMLSAVAASSFFAYVLYRVRPFGARDTAEVNVPTSAIAPAISLLRSGDGSTLSIELRDIDEAQGYRDSLSDTMRKSFGIKAAGRCYRLRVQNTGKVSVQVTAPRFTATEGAKTWQVRWLADVADASQATPNGMLTLGQAVAEFALAPGELRQLVVFVEGDAPPAETFSAAEFRADGLDVQLKREQVKTGQQ